MEENNKITILTPFRNPGVYFEVCIKSILEQSYKDWELILIDDSSDDGSLEVAKRFESQDQRITVLINTQPGLIHALRMGYDSNSGNFITRMDADDIMLPKKLETLHKSLSNQGIGHVAVGHVKYFKEGSELGEGYVHYANWLNALTSQGSNYEEIYRECVIPSPNFLIHTEDFERIGAFTPDTYPEDYDLTFRMYQNGIKVIPCDILTHMWRDHDTRSTRTQEHYKTINFIPLKTNYFIDIDYNDKKELVVWGAAKKGKLIAQTLIARKIPFTWVTENKQRIGHNVYNVIIEDANQKTNWEDCQVILAVSNRTEQKEILVKINYSSDQKGDTFLFF